MLKMTSVTNLSRSGVPHTKNTRNIAKFKLKASKQGFRFVQKPKNSKKIIKELLKYCLVSKEIKTFKADYRFSDRLNFKTYLFTNMHIERNYGEFGVFYGSFVKKTSCILIIGTTVFSRKRQQLIFQNFQTSILPFD